MISDDDPHLIFCCDLGKEYWYWAKFKVGLKSHKHYIYIYVKTLISRLIVDQLVLKYMYH